MPGTWRRAAFLSLFAVLARCVFGDAPISPTFSYGSETVRGVNLGGWLVLEVSTVRQALGSTLTTRLAAMDYSEPFRQHRQRCHR